MKALFHTLGVLGLLLALYGITSAFLYANVTWYSYFVIGLALFLAWINYLLKNGSIFEQKGLDILKTYGVYLIFTCLSEAIFRFVFHLWYFPHFGPAEQALHVFLIGYPFILFSINEGLTLIRRQVPSLTIAVILATLVFAFISEIPNTHAWEWVYTLPYVTFEILQINIVVIVGWVILIAIPIATRRILE